MIEITCVCSKCGNQEDIENCSVFCSDCLCCLDEAEAEEKFIEAITEASSHNYLWEERIKKLIRVIDMKKKKSNFFAELGMDIMKIYFGYLIFMASKIIFEKSIRPKFYSEEK